LKKSYSGTGSLQNTKLSGPKEKHPQTYHNQTLSTQEKDRILKAAKEKRQLTYKGKHI
jgi:hypothetical protein